MNYLKWLLIPMLLVAAASCATMKVEVNGAPPAANLVMMKSPATGIEAYGAVIRHYFVREGEEGSIRHEYMPIETLLELTGDTRALSVALRIVNDRKAEYSLWEIYHTRYSYQTYPFKTEHQIYSGRISFREFKLFIPIEDAIEGSYRIEIRDKNGDSIFRMGDVMYRWKGGPLPGSGSAPKEE